MVDLQCIVIVSALLAAMLFRGSLLGVEWVWKRCPQYTGFSYWYKEWFSCLLQPTWTGTHIHTVKYYSIGTLICYNPSTSATGTRKLYSSPCRQQQSTNNTSQFSYWRQNYLHWMTSLSDSASSIAPVLIRSEEERSLSAKNSSSCLESADSELYSTGVVC